MDEEIVDIKTIIQETKGMVLLGENIITFLGGCVSLDEVGITFNAYRRKLEEDAQ